MMRRDGKRRLDTRRVSLAKAPKDHHHLGLCLNYTGSGFRGLQLQAHGPTAHTVEGVLLQALKDAEIIADVVRGRPEGDQHHFARSCRTDRGVHAIRNMISLFVPCSVVEKAGGLAVVRDKVNAQLPPMVRVADVMLLAGNFIPRHCCNRRVYRYLLPLYALLPPCDTWATLEKTYPGCLAAMRALAQSQQAQQEDALYGVPYLDVAQLPSSDETTTTTTTAVSSAWVRDTQAKVRLCNEVLAAYFTGSRRYHNFSVDIDSNRSSVSAKVVQPDTDEALRVIYRCEVLPRLFLLPCATAESGEAQPLHGDSWAEYRTNRQYASAGDDAAAVQGGPRGGATFINPLAQLPAGTTALPFLVFQIEGGSFLLNMIRKMVGSLLAVCRGARPAILDDALSPERRVTTPLAPGPYLYLAQSTYHGYNRSLSALAGTRLMSVQRAWAGAVDDAAERFAFHNIAADIVDVDLNAMPPLDDVLAARDIALAVRRPQTALEDAHLAEMKEYKAVVPSRTAWPACSEMTIFLRLLRVHNWNVRVIKLDPNCKALKEVRNREERAAAAAAEAASATAAVPDASTEHNDVPMDDSTMAAERRDSTSVPADANPANETPSASAAASSSPTPATADMAEAEIPDGGADGWLYLASSAADALAQRQAYFESRWKRARPWEFGSGDADGAGGEDDVDDDDAESGASSRQRRRK